MQHAGVMDLMQEVFLGCLKFLNWPLNIEGFTFSLWQIALFMWAFIMSFNFICRMFGHEPIDYPERGLSKYEEYDDAARGSYGEWFRRNGRRS